MKTILVALALFAVAGAPSLAEEAMPAMSPAGMSLDQPAPEPLPDAAFLAAHGVRVGDLVLYDAFTRAMPPTARTGGGWVSIANTGSTDDRLVSASSPAAPVVQLHNMIMDNGIMVMREIQGGIVLPAGKAVTLKPGGMHLMFIDAPKPFAEGESVDVTLTFEKAGAVTFSLPVAALGATEMPMMH